MILTGGSVQDIQILIIFMMMSFVLFGVFYISTSDNSCLPPPVSKSVICNILPTTAIEKVLFCNDENIMISEIKKINQKLYFIEIIAPRVSSDKYLLVIRNR